MINPVPTDDEVQSIVNVELPTLEDCIDIGFVKLNMFCKVFNTQFKMFVVSIVQVH